MIVRNDKETVAIHHRGLDTIEIWRFVEGKWKSAWQAIRSCFGRGFWSNLKPFRNADGWRNF